MELLGPLFRGALGSCTAPPLGLRCADGLDPPFSTSLDEGYELRQRPAPGGLVVGARQAAGQRLVHPEDVGAAVRVGEA